MIRSNHQPKQTRACEPVSYPNRNRTVLNRNKKIPIAAILQEAMAYRTGLEECELKTFQLTRVMYAVGEKWMQILMMDQITRVGAGTLARPKTAHRHPPNRLELLEIGLNEAHEPRTRSLTLGVLRVQAAWNTIYENVELSTPTVAKGKFNEFIANFCQYLSRDTRVVGAIRCIAWSQEVPFD